MLGSDHRYFIGQDNNGEHSGSTTKPEESARVHQDSKHRHPQAVVDRASEVAKGTIAADSQLSAFWLLGYYVQCLLFCRATNVKLVSNISPCLFCLHFAAHRDSDMDADRVRGGGGRHPVQIHPDRGGSRRLPGEHEDREGHVKPAGQPAVEGVVGVHPRRPGSNS